MKIIHCADLHLDSKLSANLPKEKSKERRSELLITFQKMVTYASKNDVSAIIIAGDLFDTKHVSATAKKVVLNEMITHPKIDFYYIKGNHDHIEFSGEESDLPRNIHLFSESWTYYKLTDKEKHNIVIAGAELNSKNSHTLYSSLLLEPYDFNIVTLHGQEAEIDEKNKAEIIGLRSLRGKNIDYLALGHIHKYKLAQLDTRGSYCYPGCLEGRGFDECGIHGFVLLNINENLHTYDHEFIPFARRIYYTEEVDISECKDTYDVGKVVGDRIKDYPATSLIKVVLSGQSPVDFEVDINFLAKRFSDDFYYIKIDDKTEIMVNYQDYLYDESLKGEFVRTVQKEPIDDETKASIIKIGLQALAGGDL